MKKIIAVIAFVASAFLACRALLLQFNTIATNDSHAYQPVLTAGLAWSIGAILLVALYIALAKNRWRFAAILPIVLCVAAWWRIARMWPDAFA